MALVGSGLNCALHLGSFLKLHATESFCETFLVFKDNCPPQPSQTHSCLFPSSFKTCVTCTPSTVTLLVRCQCFQGFAVLCVQEFKLTLSTPEVETFPFPRMHRFGPDQLLEPFLLGGDVASPYVGANALFAGPGGGLVALASLLFLQEDLNTGC